MDKAVLRKAVKLSCCGCNYVRWCKYKVPTCEKIMKPLLEIEKCPKNKAMARYIKTEKQYERLDSNEDISYSEKLRYADALLHPEEQE